MFSRIFKRAPTYKPATRQELLDEYAVTMPSKPGQILSFEGVGDKDVYNPAFFMQDGHPLLAARVESRASKWRSQCYDPQVMFFRPKNGTLWQPIPEAPVIAMEDPFITWVHQDGQKLLILGGVMASAADQPASISTVFFKGKDIFSLEPEPFVRIPGMKDIRLVELSDQKRKILCTRPRGGQAGVGMIGVAEITDLSEITPTLVQNAPLLSDQADPDIKMGPNSLYCVQHEQNGHTAEYVGVVGHASFEDPGTREEHYYVVAFCFDPNNPLLHPDWRRPKIIAKRSDFGPADGKEPRLEDVVFPGGVEQIDSMTARLFTGVGDTCVGSIEIPHPFAHCHIIAE